MNIFKVASFFATLQEFIVPLTLIYIVSFYALTWKRPWLALALIFAMSPFQNDLSGGGGARFSIAEINLMLTVPLLILRGRRWRMGPISVPISLYLLWALICSTITTRNSTTNSMLQMVLYFVVTVVVFSSLVRNEKDFKPALNAMVGVGVVFALLSLSGRFGMLGLNKNGVGASLSVAVLVCCELWFNEERRRHRAWLTVAFGIIAIGLFMTLSRGAWLGSVAGLVVLCAVRGQYGLLLRVGGVLLPLLVVGWFSLPQKSKEYTTGFSAKDNYNIKLRLQSLTIAQDEFERSPFFGVGVGLRKEYDATNVAMLTLAETGVPGLVFFAAIHFVLLSTVWKAGRKLRRDDPLFPYLALAGALIISRLAHGMVDHYWSRGAITPAWASVGMSTFAYYALRRRAREERRARFLAVNAQRVMEQQRRRAAYLGGATSSTRLVPGNAMNAITQGQSEGAF